MAQGSGKSRIIIWAIVGILVVIAVVMLVTKPKDSGKLPVNAERFVRQMDGRFQKLEVRVSDAQAENPGAPAELWQEISDEIALGRQVLAGMPGLTEQKDLQAKRDSVQKAYLAARRVLKEITGREDVEGGE
ncbi:hypothetical protein JXD38_07520 [candidate division WOR-3 bacterium]|nr:hypothetical protein [candidate division WOR-3 bacterium]